MVRLFAGYDPRETAGFHSFLHSVISRASQPLGIYPLAAEGFKEGSNAFTFSRFMVAHRCRYKGRAIFCDASDMLMLADIAELDDLFDPRYAVQVVKHPDYTSRHGRKYVGTPMECDQSNYSRKNWASVMLVNAEHAAWSEVTPQIIAASVAGKLMELRFLRDEDIGELPPQWNVLVDEGQSHDGAKLLHWTAGIPGFDQYKDAPRADDWFAARKQMAEVVQ
jgi:hypothetical protein